MKEFITARNKPVIRLMLGLHDIMHFCKIEEIPLSTSFRDVLKAMTSPDTNTYSMRHLLCLVTHTLSNTGRTIRTFEKTGLKIDDSMIKFQHLYGKYVYIELLLVDESEVASECD